MGYLPGVPLSSKMIFKSGDEVVILRWAPIMRGKMRMRRLYMVLTEQTRERYSIDESRLDYSFSEYGVYVREYPDAFFEELTSNPENPLCIVHCNFQDASPITSHNDPQGALRMKIAGLEVDLNNARNENMALRENNKSMIEYVREMEDQLGI